MNGESHKQTSWEDGNFIEKIPELLQESPGISTAIRIARYCGYEYLFTTDSSIPLEGQKIIIFHSPEFSAYMIYSVLKNEFFMAEVNENKAVALHTSAVSICDDDTLLVGGRYEGFIRLDANWKNIGFNLSQDGFSGDHKVVPIIHAIERDSMDIVGENQGVYLH